MAHTTFYRMVSDIIPSKIDHRFEGGGIFGDGTYFHLNYRYKWSMDDDYKFCVITAYKISPKNPLSIQSKDEPDLVDAVDLKIRSNSLANAIKKKTGSTVSCENLSKLCSKNGFDSLLVTGTGSNEPDGGNQLIIPSTSDLAPNPIWFDVCFHDKKSRDKLLKAVGRLGESRTANAHYDVTNIPWEYSDAVSRFLSKMGIDDL